MNGETPLWAAITIVAFLIFGCGLTLIGCIGMTTFKSFYDRLHMPTLGSSWGIGSILIASMLYTAFVDGHVVMHELLITIFLVVTTPVVLMLLSRAAMHRERTNDWRDLPPEIFEIYRRKKIEEEGGDVGTLPSADAGEDTKDNVGKKITGMDQVTSS